MKKRVNNRVNKTPVILGIIGFFLLVAGISTIVILTFSAVSESLAENRTAIALIMLAVITVLSAFCTAVDIVRRRLTVEKPVNEILNATDEIAQGNFEVKLTPRHTYSRYDEYDFIMENLNKMSAELAKSEVLRTDFISNVSHELKTPLAIIRNYAAELAKGGLPQNKREEYCATLVVTANRLSNLVSNILSLNKLENQQITSQKEVVRLEELLAQSVLGFENAIEDKAIDLQCDFDEITIETLPNYLEIVFNNLMSNAVKFTPNGGKIAVTLKRNGNEAVVSIEDNGCGISSDTGKRIFDKFYQGDTSHASEGNGLGLALVKKVIDVLGGEIAVQSEVNKGSVFTVKLKGVIDNEK